MSNSLFDVKTAFNCTNHILEFSLLTSKVPRDLILGRERRRQPFLNFLRNAFAETGISVVRGRMTAEQESVRSKMNGLLRCC